MKAVLFITISSIFIAGSFGATVRLNSGIAQRFSITTQDQPVVLTGITVAVPGGSTRLTIDLDSDTTDTLTLFARFDQTLVAQDGGVAAADFISHVAGAHQEIIISRTRSPP